MVRLKYGAIGIDREAGGPGSGAETHRAATAIVARSVMTLA